MASLKLSREESNSRAERRPRSVDGFPGRPTGQETTRHGVGSLWTPLPSGSEVSRCATSTRQRCIPLDATSRGRIGGLRSSCVSLSREWNRSWNAEPRFVASGRGVSISAAAATTFEANDRRGSRHDLRLPQGAEADRACRREVPNLAALIAGTRGGLLTIVRTEPTSSATDRKRPRGIVAIGASRSQGRSARKIARS